VFVLDEVVEDGEAVHAAETGLLKPPSSVLS
jgi:hypothetical protein